MSDQIDQHKKELLLFDVEVKRLKAPRTRFSKKILNLRHDLGTLIKAKRLLSSAFLPCF